MDDVQRARRSPRAKRRIAARRAGEANLDAALRPRSGRTIYAFDTLREAVESTGGSLHPPGFFTERNAAAIFDKVYADFRRSYLLRFLPRGVTRVGWHDVAVTIPRFPSLEIRARHGYLVEAAAPARPVAPPEPAPGTISAVMAASASADLTSLRSAVASVPGDAALAAVIKDFRAAGNVWPANPRREFATALVVAAAAVESSAADLRREAVDLIAHEATLVRPPTGPDDFERDWLGAASSILAGAMRPADTFPIVRSAVARFPDDPQLLLARAVVADQLGTLAESAGGQQLGALAQQQLFGYYDAAIGHDETTVEARIRKAWLLRRLGRDGDARAQLDLLGGKDLGPELGAWRDAVASTSILMPPPLADPTWRSFWQGAFRSLPALMDRLWRRAQTSD